MSWPPNWHCCYLMAIHCGSVKKRVIPQFIDFFQCFVGWPWLKTGNCILRSRLCFIITEGTVDEGEINGKTPTYGSPFKKMMFLFKTAHYSFLDGSMQKDVENHFPGENPGFPNRSAGQQDPSASPRARRDRRRTAHGIPSGWGFWWRWWEAHGRCHSESLSWCQ